MLFRPEHQILFYSSVAGHDEFIRERIAELLERADRGYLVNTAPMLGVAGGLMGRLVDAGFSGCDIVDDLREAAINEMRTTASMKSLALEITALLRHNGIEHVPLKGCDPRIAEGARGFFNAMQDIDILVREDVFDEVARILERQGYLCAGPLSPSHVTFFTDEEIPRLIEVHHDLVNRSNPLHSRLFPVKIDRVWERFTVMCSVSLLSPCDLLSYTVAHAVKEYFHKPKWLADLAWIIELVAEECDAREMRNVVGEWGVARALGIAGAALQALFPGNTFDAVSDYGAVRPGPLGRYCAERLISYDRLRSLRPLLYIASADSTVNRMRVAGSIVKRAFRR